MIREIIYTMIVAIDIFFSSVIANGHNITISSRCGIATRENGNKWLIKLGKFLNYFEENHCELSIQADIERAKKAIEYLNRGKKDLGP